MFTYDEIETIYSALKNYKSDIMHTNKCLNSLINRFDTLLDERNYVNDAIDDHVLDMHPEQ